MIEKHHRFKINRTEQDRTDMLLLDLPSDVIWLILKKYIIDRFELYYGHRTFTSGSEEGAAYEIHTMRFYISTHGSYMSRTMQWLSMVHPKIRQLLKRKCEWVNETYDRSLFKREKCVYDTQTKEELNNVHWRFKYF